jgi:hypothetical protein
VEVNISYKQLMTTLITLGTASLPRIGQLEHVSKDEINAGKNSKRCIQEVIIPQLK